MQPWIRDYNYIKDYYDTVYKIFSTCYIGYPVTYYAIDKENTIWDDRELNGGSYEKLGIGDLTGVVFKKILMFPVYAIEPIIPSSTSGEKGINYADSMSSSFLIPSFYNFIPTPEDIVHFSQKFMMMGQDIRPLFTITGIDTSTFGECTVYRCKIKVAPCNVSDVDKQVSQHLQFCEFTKRIHPIKNTQFLLRLQSRAEESKKRIATYFDRALDNYVG